MVVCFIEGRRSDTIYNTFETSRWKTASERDAKIEELTKKCGCNITAFPDKNELQNLFVSSNTRSHMPWHDEGRAKDGVLHYPNDLKE